MATIGSLRVDVSARTTKFSRGMRKSQSILVDFTSHVRRSTGRLVAFGAALTAIAGGAGLIALTRSAFKSIDATGKLATRLGVTTESLISLRHAAALGGVESEQFDKALEQMVRRLGEVRMGSGEAMDALDGLGLSADSLVSMSPDQAFIEIAESIKGLENRSDQAAAAYKLFGRQGVTLLNVLNSGREGIENVAAEAERLGLTFNAVEAKKIEQANDAIEKMRSRFLGVVNVLAIELAPFVQATAEFFTELGLEGNQASKFIVDGFEFAAKAIAQVVDVLNLAKGVFKGLQSVVTLGISFGLRQMALIPNALNLITEGLFGVKIAGVETINAIASELEALAGEQLNDAIDAYEQFERGVNSRKVERAFAEIRRRAQEAAEAIVESEQSTGDLGLESLAEKQQSIDSIIRSLQEQADTLGMSRMQVQLWKLEQAGATEETIKLARALAGQIEEFHEHQKAVERAKQIYEETRTPLERYEKSIGELSDLLNKQLIDWDTYTRAVRAAREELEGVAEAADRGTRSPSLIQRRFTSGFNDPSINRANAFDPQKAIERINKRILEKANEENNTLRRIERELITQDECEVYTL